MEATYTREELLHKVHNTSDIVELRELAWLINEEENCYCPAVFSELYYHLECRLNELANAYLADLRSVIRIMQATR